MSDERIDSIVNRSEVKNDFDFIDGLLSSVMKKIAEINNLKVSIDTGKGMTNAAQQADKAAQATAQAAQATEKLASANKALDQSLSTIDQQWRNIAGQLKDNLKLQLQYESELKKVKGLIKEQNDAVKDTGTSYNTVSKKLIELKQRETELKTAISEVNQTIKAQVKETQAAEGSYDAMNQELGQMRNLYRQLSAEERGAGLGKTLLKNITVLDAELKKIDATMGNFQRNVGNYKEGWNGLGNSINQITRELPAFTYSAQTGFLAISNNLPILFDEITRTKNSIAAMRADGQKVPGLFKQIASSIFSWGTALSLGVTLLTIYGKEIGNFFASLFKGKEAAKSLADAQKEVNEELEKGGGEYKTAVEDISRLEKTIQLAKSGVIDKTAALKEFNEKIHLASGEVKSLDEAEKFLTDHKQEFLDMMLQKSIATIAYQKAAEKAMESIIINQKKANDFIDTGDKFASFFGSLSSAPGYTGQLDLSNKKQIDYLNKVAAEKRKAQLDNAKKEEDLMKKIADDAATLSAQLSQKIGLTLNNDKREKDKKSKEDKIFEEGDAIRKANYETQKAILEDNIRINDEIVQNDEAAFLKRTAAANKYLAATIALRRLEYEYSIKDINAKEANDTASAEREYKNVKEREKAVQYIKDSAARERKAALVKYNTDELKINDDYQNKYLVKLRDFLKKQKEEEQKHEEAQADLRAGNLKNQYAEKNNQVDKLYADGLITEQQYNKKKLILQYEYNVKSLRLEIELAEKRLEIAKAAAVEKGDVGSFDAIAKAEQNLATLRISLEQKVAEFKINQNKRGNEAIKKDIEALATYSSAAVELFGYIGGFLNARYEKEKNRIQEQIDLIEKKKAAEIEAINATTASTEEKAAKIAVINARAAAQEQALELKKRQAQQKQARWDKAMTIASIVQETALAVVRALGMKPYTPANIAQAAIVGGLGAAKLAVAVATPIPQYAEGTGDKDHPGGLAYVGDGGKKELVVTPSGKSYVTPDKSTLVNLPKGTKVFPDASEVMESLKNTAFKQMPVTYVNENNYSEHMVKALMGEMQLLREAVKNKETIQLNATAAGLSAMHKKQNNFWQYIGTNIR